nr:immunoglobulin heavy chain junction region [Macaca mulatta]
CARSFPVGNSDYW